ncbi:Sphingomyelin phosphodiesterase [Spathaspora sp. JA1]|nr:Sphingomyelin phosphodiesterase [Spathaspora sp. JA1]
MLLLWFILTLIPTLYAFEEKHNNYYPPTELVVDDEELVTRAIQELHNIDAASDLRTCATCKARLQVAKFLALTRPDLVPQIFSTWCIEAGYDEIQCHMNYGYPNSNYSSTGNDFTKMASLMSPSGIDGDYFCYYHDKNCHILPETPLVDVSRWWPSKPRVYPAPEGNGDLFHVLHISDINLQLNYKMFAEANCSQSLCCTSGCKNNNFPPIINDNLEGGYYESSYSQNHFIKGNYQDITKIKKPVWSPARQFGEYTCDVPTLLLNSTLQCIRDLHQNHLSFEFALFTGGTVDHSDRSLMTKHKVLKSQDMSHRILKHYLDSVPVIPTFGVRDIFPLNQLPQKNLTENINSYQWQFDFLSDLWSELGWLDFDATKEVRYSQIGFALTTLRGLKIISLNSNVWNVKNLYAFWDMLSLDSFGIWKFLVEELLLSEKQNQRVWILAHLPTNHQSLPIPTKIFTQIIERFSPKVIAEIFFGNIQIDTFMIHYVGNGTDPKQITNAINHALIGPSISPYAGMNPSWRYYAVDGLSFNIVNSFTYYTNLESTFHNDGAEPVWEFGYSARDIYDPEKFWPPESPLNTKWWHHVGQKINESPFMQATFEKLETRGLETGEVDVDSYCKITSFTVEAKKQCMITDDQDDYTEPNEINDYIPSIKPYEKVTYVEKEIANTKDETDSKGEEVKEEPKNENVVDTGDEWAEVDSNNTEVEKLNDQKPVLPTTSRNNKGKSISLKDRIRNHNVRITQLNRL